MCSTRTFHTRTVAAVIAWKLAALALLPAAFCCHAMFHAEGGVRPCCEGTHRGDFCPLERAAEATDPDIPRLQTCDSFDDALIGLLSQTGFTPESSAPPPAPVASSRLPQAGQLVTPCYHTPPAPPPRA